ncbi:MAG: MGMT family protein [Candidatus Omnitrophica bacterium]|nr:MGMT family protein [Candidatus Omnitrophota bacterium]
MTEFARRVFRVVSTIPLGETRSYKWVAKKSGRPNAYRAVGNILNKNPWPVIIPCHRVVKCGNDLGGYVFGVKKKVLLLSRERKIKEFLTARLVI